MTLAEWLGIYTARNSLAQASEAQLLVTVKQLAIWHGKAVPIGLAADCDFLNRYLLWVERVLERSAYTIIARRRNLLTLLDAAADDGLCPAVRRRKVRCPRCPALIPKCLTAQQMGRLIAACDDWDAQCRSMPHYRDVLPNGKPRGLFWKTFVATAWDTALRLSDVLALERQDITLGRGLTIVQAKSGRQHRVQFHQQTLAWIDDLMDGDDHGAIIPVWCERRQFYRHFKNLTTFAGVPCTTKWIRRGSASQYEADNPGQAWKHLGHSAPGLDRKFYLNPQIAYPERPMVRSVTDG